MHEREEITADFNTAIHVCRTERKIVEIPTHGVCVITAEYLQELERKAAELALRKTITISGDLSHRKVFPTS